MAVCATIISACDKETPTDQPNPADETIYIGNSSDKYAMVTKVSVLVFDKDSCDMLNPNYNKDGKNFDMALYKDQEMRQKRTECFVLDTCHNFWNMADTTTYYYMFFYAPLDYSKDIPEESKKIWYSTSYLSIDGATVDTIRTEVVESANSLILKKAFYNGKDLSETNGVVVK